jgi:hypothetical protein
MFIDRFVRLPGFVRRLFLWALFKNPQLIKEYYDPVLVSSVGMFGTGSGGEFRYPIIRFNFPWVGSFGDVAPGSAQLSADSLGRMHLLGAAPLEHLSFSSDRAAAPSRFFIFWRLEIITAGRQSTGGRGGLRPPTTPTSSLYHVIPKSLIIFEARHILG